jgi:hypothetical protein
VINLRLHFKAVIRIAVERNGRRGLAPERTRAVFSGGGQAVDFSKLHFREGIIFEVGLSLETKVIEHVGLRPVWFIDINY